MARAASQKRKSSDGFFVLVHAIGDEHRRAECDVVGGHHDSGQRVADPQVAEADFQRPLQWSGIIAFVEKSSWIEDAAELREEALVENVVAFLGVEIDEVACGADRCLAGLGLRTGEAGSNDTAGRRPGDNVEMLGELRRFAGVGQPLLKRGKHHRRDQASDTAAVDRQNEVASWPCSPPSPPPRQPEESKSYNFRLNKPKGLVFDLQHGDEGYVRDVDLADMARALLVFFRFSRRFALAIWRLGAVKQEPI